MKNSTMLASLLCVFLVGNVKAQDYPDVTEDEDSYVLRIPYLEYEDEEGEKKAVSAKLIASKHGEAISFSLVESALDDVDVDTPAAVTGEGACSRTTEAQLLACRADVTDDYFEALANCFNTSDPDAKAECMEVADEERGDALEACGEVEAAHDSLCLALGEAPYDPDLGAVTFVDVDAIAANPNPYFPLIPGNQWVYEGEDETITVTVLDETRDIMGIEAVVVRDTAEEDGEVIEDTRDWYAQDSLGNVWYMGELSLNYEDGELVDIEGSWETGKEGAKPGILFRAMPVVGEIYRQEYRIGEAEDIGETVSLTADESTESGYECGGMCLQNLEYTPLEPDGQEYKYYLPGTGLILEVNPEDDERVELVDFIQAN